MSAILKNVLRYASAGPGLNTDHRSTSGRAQRQLPQYLRTAGIKPLHSVGADGREVGIRLTAPLYRKLLFPEYANQRIYYVYMKTFGAMLSEARRAAGMSQKELAAKVIKEDGQAISAQYLNDIEHDRRNPPSEFLIGQIAEVLKLDKDTLCLAAGTVPQDLRENATIGAPEEVKEAVKAFRRALKKAKP